MLEGAPLMASMQLSPQILFFEAGALLHEKAARDYKRFSGSSPGAVICRSKDAELNIAVAPRAEK